MLTGKVVWAFHTIPYLGEFGYETWPKDGWKNGGGTNTWGEISIDEKRGIAYFPIGSPTYDFYRADRVGKNLFGDCLLALDARTGKRLWHFQIVHHDLRDYDPSAAPKLLTIAVLLSADSIWSKLPLIPPRDWMGRPCPPAVAGAHKVLIEEHAQFVILNGDTGLQSAGARRATDSQFRKNVRRFVRTGGALVVTGGTGITINQFGKG